MLVSAIRREPGRFVFLTGAGMSLSAGIPSSTWLLSEIRQKFSNELAELSPEELQNLSVGMRALSVEERRSVLKPYFDGLKINWSHIALACMMRANHVSRVLTFNFDNILARACGLVGLYPATYDFGISPATEFDYLSSPSVIHLRGQGYGSLLTDGDNGEEDTAEKLRPFLHYTLANSNLVILGYDGRMDPFFPKLVETYGGRRRIYWLGHQEEPHRHLEPLLKGRHQNLVRYFGGVDADEMMIKLAQELGCFPPDVLTHPARHVLMELASIATFPLAKTNLTIDILEAARARLRGEGDHLKLPATAGGTVGTRSEALKRDELPIASRNDNVGIVPPVTRQAATPPPLKPIAEEKFVALKPVARSPIEPEKPQAITTAAAEAQKEKDTIPQPAKIVAEVPVTDPETKAWSHFVEGYNNSEMAEQGDRERHLRKACEEYAQAVRLKPNFYEALNNWGICLRKLGDLRRDENFYTHAIHKYELALKYKPDFLQALNNWAIVLSELAKLRGDDSLYALSIEKYEQALAIKPDFYQALNDWGSKLSLTWKLTDKDEYMRRADDVWAQALELNPNHIYEKAGQAADSGNEPQAREYLEKSLSYGTLPSPEALLLDPKFQMYRHRDWFIQLLDRLRTNKKVG